MKLKPGTVEKKIQLQPGKYTYKMVGARASQKTMFHSPRVDDFFLTVAGLNFHDMCLISSRNYDTLTIYNYPT